MISVLVPVYNTEKYLRRCLDSVLAQTFQDFELILVDDGSTDASGRICDEYAAKDERIVVFHQKNKGQAAARNVALDYVLASNYSEWITFIDSDDVVHPQILEMLYLGIIGTSEKLIAGDLQFFKNNERPEFQKKIQVRLRFALCFRRRFSQPITTLKRCLWLNYITAAALKTSVTLREKYTRIIMLPIKSFFHSAVCFI